MGDRMGERQCESAMADGQKGKCKGSKKEGERECENEESNLSGSGTVNAMSLIV